MIRVELLRAWPQRFEATMVTLPMMACVGDALDAAGWQLDHEHVGLAIFGQAAKACTILHDGDRIELLRALQLDPKQARRARARKTRQAISGQG